MKIVMFSDEAFQDNLNLIDVVTKLAGATVAKPVVAVIECMEKAQHVPDIPTEAATPSPVKIKRPHGKVPMKKVVKKK